MSEFNSKSGGILRGNSGASHTGELGASALSETALQSACFLEHWNSRPNERGRLFHVNQKARNIIEGNRMKAMGVVKGVSDMIYLSHGGKCLFLEFKIPGGKQSPDQVKFQKMAQDLGFEYIIVTSKEQFWEVINAAGI